MKKAILPFLLAFPAMCGLYAQPDPCSEPSSQIDLFGNNIRARILNNGTLFTDGDEGQFVPNPEPGGQDPSTIYIAGLWLGGIDPGGNLKLSVVEYGVDGSDYAAGPLNDQSITTDPVCENWDRHFRVTGAEIAAFLQQLPALQLGPPSAAVAAFPDIMGWPGQGNPFFFDVHGFDLPFSIAGLAPFLDANDDGLYNPLQGDYPVVQLRNKPPFVPAEIVWNVFNDQRGGAPAPSGGKSFQMEVQLTSWAFNCLNQPLLNNTVFTAHKLINRGTEVVDSTYVGLWVDFDLGCHTDDFIGSRPTQDAFYAYNTDAVDGQPGSACTGGVATFADTPPVQSTTFLSVHMDKFIYLNNSTDGPVATTSPNAPSEYYNYLTGSWKDGTPLTFGNDGYQETTPADFAFPDDPANPTGWSMCAEGLAGGDRLGMGIHRIGQLLPGAVNELVTAWTVHPNPPLPCNLGTTFSDIDALHSFYLSSFAGVCSPVSDTNAPWAAALEIFPNPAAEVVTVQYKDVKIKMINLFAADGRLVRTLPAEASGELTFSVADLSNGIYTLRFVTSDGVGARKISVLR